jgi:hypothetical protein
MAYINQESKSKMNREFTSYYQARSLLETLDHGWLLVTGSHQGVNTYLVTDDEEKVDKMRGQKYIVQCRNNPEFYDETTM